MLSTNDSMSIDTTPTQNGTDSTDTITDLRDLRVGDRVVFGGRTDGPQSRLATGVSPADD